VNLPGCKEIRRSLKTKNRAVAKSKVDRIKFNVG
jgi:hypothetical protein